MPAAIGNESSVQNQVQIIPDKGFELRQQYRAARPQTDGNIYAVIGVPPSTCAIAAPTTLTIGMPPQVVGAIAQGQRRTPTRATSGLEREVVGAPYAHSSLHTTNGHQRSQNLERLWRW